MSQKRQFGTAETALYLYGLLFVISYVLFEFDASLHPLLGAAVALVLLFGIMTVYYAGLLDGKLPFTN